MKPSVVVVGSFVQDLTFFCDAFPTRGETTLGRFASGPGGKGSNQAVAAARAGVPTRFIGAVGEDAFGKSAANFHRREGIDSRLVTKRKHSTATAGIVVNRAGENEIVVAIGASAMLRPVDVSTALLRGASVVVAQHESSLVTNTHAFRTARRLGATTVLNPAPMRPDFDPVILRHVDVLIPNESEFVALVQLLPRAAELVRKPAYTERGTFGIDTLPGVSASALHELCRTLSVPVVIVTLGPRGCFVSLADRCEHLPAHDVSVIDSTGAGDAFVGGFAAGLVKFKDDPILAAQFANVIAALSVTKPGTSESMPKRAEIDRFMRRIGTERTVARKRRSERA